MEIKKGKTIVTIKLSIAEAEAIRQDFDKSLTYNYWDNETTQFLAKYFKRELEGVE